MNSVINKLDLDKCLFVDIETVRGQKTLDERNQADEQLFRILQWMYRDTTNDTLLPNDEVIKTYLRRGALTPEVGKIVCISVGKFESGKFYTKSFFGDDEVKILKQFVDTVKASPRTLVGHNIVKFDLPYIRKRFFINGLEDYLSEANGNDSNVKPWDLDKVVIDTMSMWQGTTFVATSLDLLSYSLGIPSPKADGLKGNEVSEAYYNGRINEIVSYCERDVVAVANVVRRLKGLEVIEEVQTLTKLDGSTSQDPTSGLIDIIRADGKISKKNMTKLLALLNKHKDIDLTKVIDILNAALAFSKNSLTALEVDLILSNTKTESKKSNKK